MGRSGSALAAGFAASLLVAASVLAGCGTETHSVVDYGEPQPPAAEHVNPAGYRAVEVVVARTLPNAGVVTKVITSRPVIAELARRLNAMHPLAKGVIGCRLATSVRERLIFEPGSGRVSQVVATLMPCNSVQLRVGGRTEPARSDRGDLLALVSRLVQREVNRSGHRGPPPPVS